MSVFLRLLDASPEEKSSVLARVADQWRSGRSVPETFEVDASSFHAMPGAPFAYWVSDRVRELGTRLPPLETGRLVARRGLASHDDFRFLRLWSEVGGSRWVTHYKGGAFSPFYHDPPMMVDWAKEGRLISAPRSTERAYDTAIVASPHLYFLPGLTWARRTTSDVSFRAMPASGIFGDKGPALVFVESNPGDENALLGLLAVLQSQAFRGVLALRMAAATAAARSYEVGIIRAMPFPPEVGSQAAEIAENAWRNRRSRDRTTQASRAFVLPGLLQADGRTLEDRREDWERQVITVEAEFARLQEQIDEIAFTLYGLDGEDRRRMEFGFGDGGSPDGDSDAEPEDDEEEEVEGTDAVTLVVALLEWALGAALGRFDVRLATGERTLPPDPDPFDPLPVCSPGMLQNAASLPARAAPAGYPLQIPPQGILVDDPGHPWDVVARIEAVFERVAEGRAHEWLQEAEAILGRNLRDWLRRYGFERHLKRYSRSRRKAPLFWHLAPKSREYGIWLYSPVATRDTFYRIQNDYVEPKLKAAERRLLELRQTAGASPAGQQRKDLASQESLVEELRAFREQVALVAPLWTPCRDDGIVLNCAVLWGLFDHHRTWQKECAKKWDELADGKYDWAGWAMHLWPERAVAACASDRSIAIAHGLEEALWEEGEDGKWEPRADAQEQVSKLVAERSSPAVQAALAAFERAG